MTDRPKESMTNQELKTIEDADTREIIAEMRAPKPKPQDTHPPELCEICGKVPPCQRCGK